MKFSRSLITLIMLGLFIAPTARAESPSDPAVAPPAKPKKIPCRTREECLQIVDTAKTKLQEVQPGSIFSDFSQSVPVPRPQRPQN
jgi:hypothetical protein